MSDRRVKVVFEAEIANFKKGVSEAARETEKLAKATESTSKHTSERMQKINAVAAADQRAAKAAGLLYNAQGQLVDANGKVLSSTQAAAHGVEAFSEAVYLAGHDAEVASAKSVAAAEKQKEAWATLGPVAAAAGAGIVAGVGLAVKKYADFDKAMSSVQAATHESTTNMQLLREAAIGAGADTAFSAEEAAQGIEELAKAGVSTQSILNGGLNGALDLAAAGALSVGEAAEISASAMTQFKLSGDQIPHLADLLAAGAGKAQGSVHDLGEALNQAGLVASSTGLSIEETTGGLAAFASAGLTGSDAGTSFKTMLQRLTPQSKEAQKKFDELGISAYDAQGEFVGLTEFAGQLQTKMADLTPEARNAAMGIMFGSDAVRASNVLYEQGAAGIQSWIDQVNDAGYAAETASIMQDNLAGDIEKLGGAFDTVFIQSGGSANDALRVFVQTAEAAVDAIGRIPAPILGLGTVIAGVGGGALLAVGGVATLVPKVIETYEAFNTLRTSGSKSVGVMKDIGKVAGIAAVAVGTLAVASHLAGTGLDDIGSQSQFGDAIKKSTKDVDAARDALNEFSSAAGSGGAGITGIGQALEVLNMNGALKAMDWVGSLGGIFDSDLKLAEESVTRFDDALSTLASSGDFESAASGFKIAAEEGAAAGLSVQQVADKFPGYMDALRNAANGAASEQEILNWALTGTEPAGVAAAGAAQETAAALEEVGVSASGAVESMEDFLDLLFQTGMITMNSRDAAAAYEEQLASVGEAVDEIAKGKMGKALNKAKDDFDLTTEAGRLANQEFQDLAKSGMDEVRAMSEEGLGQDKLQEKLNTTYSDLVKAGEGFGLLPPQAKELAREILGIPDGVSIESWMSEVAKTTAEETTKSIAEIPGYTEVTVAVTEDGTTGEVQSKINGVTGKTEYVFVTEDGTTQVVQEAIVSIDGVTRNVWVTDDGTVVGTQSDINGIKGKTATVTVVPSGVAETERVISSLAAPRSSSITFRASIVGSLPENQAGSIASRFGRSPGGYTGGLVGRLMNGLAGGGLVPGQIPLNSQGDNILAMVNGKPFGLRSGEMVVNEKATRENYPLLKAINDGLTVNLPGLAGGGRVGAAEKKVKSAQKAYSAIDSKQANRARKQAAKDQLDAAKEELKSAKAQAKLSADAAKDARERAGRLNDARFDLRRDLRRGEITDSFKSGSGMSIVDRMFTDSKSEDLSKGKRAGLRRDAFQLEGQLLRLGKQSDSLKTKLEKATEARDRLLEVSKSVSDGLRGEYSLGGVLQGLLSGEQKGPLSAGSFVKSAQGKAAQIKRFGQMLEKLRKKGYNEAIIREIADLGTTEGTQVGNALLNATGKERDQLNQAYKSMDYWSGQAGVEVTRSMERGGIDAAEGLVRGLERKTEDVEGAFYKLGKDAEKAFKRSLGIKSPSRNAMGWSADVVAGSVIGLDENTPKLETAMADLGKAGENAFSMQAALTVPPSFEVSRYAQAQSAPSLVTPEAIAQAVRAGMEGWQPMVQIGGTKFYGVMKKAADDARNPLK